MEKNYQEKTIFGSDKEFFAYLAGFFDGDGCFQLVKHKNKHYQRNYFWDAVLDVVQNNKELLEWIRGSVGGNLIHRRKIPYQYHLRFTTKQLSFLLPKIIPFLVNKKDQAMLLFEAITIKKTTKVDDEQYIKLEKISNQLKYLKPRNFYSKNNI